jgi:hypothetical protein
MYQRLSKYWSGVTVDCARQAADGMANMQQAAKVRRSNIKTPHVVAVDENLSPIKIGSKRLAAAQFAEPE